MTHWLDFWYYRKTDRKKECVWEKQREVSESWGERESECYLKNEERKRERELCALISHLDFEPAWLSGRERMREQRRRERDWESKNGNVWEMERDRGVSFSSVWPLSHSNSGLATWTPVPLSSPVTQNLTPSAPDYSTIQQHRAREHKRNPGRINMQKNYLILPTKMDLIFLEMV